MLTCENLRCEREEVRIFSGLGICLSQGALLLVRGGNGCGKTSLLKMIAGLLPCAAGEVAWRGEPVCGNAEFLQELTYIGHKGGIKPECTVEENLLFWARLRQNEMLIPAALRYFDLEEKRDVPCWQLSAGMQRKVALSRLIVAPTLLWLLDEPTNFLDDDSVTKVRGLIESRIAQEGIVIVATHSMRSSLPGHTLWLEDYK